MTIGLFNESEQMPSVKAHTLRRRREEEQEQEEDQE
jgi:hypothetical protein